MTGRRLGNAALVLSLGLGLSLLLRIGTFYSDTILLKVIATTGADYGVVLGEWKLDSPASDSVVWFTSSEVFVSGEPNPWPIDYDTMFDYFVVKGEVIGVDQVSAGDEWYPLMKVVHWERIRFMDFFLSKWVSIVGIIVSVIILWSNQRR